MRSNPTSQPPRPPRPRARQAPPADPPRSARRSPADPLASVRRLRASGGPEDRATYRCGCGLVFQAPVSTGVACPACGDPQAW